MKCNREFPAIYSVSRRGLVKEGVLVKEGGGLVKEVR
jgi:hypothetical protein